MLSERDEIMQKYAESNPGLVKTAWTWRDIVQDVGVGAAFSAVIGALPFGATSGLGGAATAAIGSFSLPITWPAVVAFTIGAAGFYYFTMSAEYIEDLISRLESLDPAPEDISTVDGWIAELKKIDPILKLREESDDIEESGKIAAEKYVALKNLEALMKEKIEPQWFQIKSRLTDRFFDPGDAEGAILDTSRVVTDSLSKIKEIAQQKERLIASDVMNEVKEQRAKLEPTGPSQTGVAGEGRPGSEVPKSKQKRWKKDPAVEKFQAAINTLNKSAGIGVNLNPDGLYGPKTSKATYDTLERLKYDMTDLGMLKDWKTTRNDKELMKNIAAALDSKVAKLEEKKLSQRQ